MKKWTYLVAAVLMSGTAPFFTSCIDNDEPEGITIIRKAKAELISAKKAIVEAEAIRLKAEAALKDAEAEFKLAQAELERAKIKQLEAQTEAEKAKYEAIIQMLQAQTNKIIKETEAAVEAAILAQQKAMEELKKAETNATKAQWEALKPYKEAYEKASENYYVASKEVLAKEKVLAEAEADKVVSVQDRRNAEKLVQTTEAALADAKAFLQGLKDEYEEKLPSLVPGEIPAKIDALKKEITKLETEIELVKAEMAEGMESNPAYAKLAELKNALVELGNKEISIAEFKNVINPDEAKYWYYEMDETVLEATKYTLGDLYQYDKALSTLLSLRNEALKYQLDEDDVKWNEALLNEAKVEYEASKKVLKGKEDLFTAAVKAYNEGKGLDVTAYIGYDKLVKAVDAYNTAADALDAQKAVVAEKQQLVDEAEKAWTDKDATGYLHRPLTIFEQARKQAQIDFDDTMTDAKAAFDAVVLPLQNKYEDAGFVVKEAEKAEALALQKLLAADSSDEGYAKLEEDYNKAVQATKDAVKAQEDAYWTWQNTLMAEGKKLSNTQSVAFAQKELDIQKAENERDKAIRDWEDGLDPEFVAELATLKQAWEEAETALKAEEDKIDYQSMYTILNAVTTASENIHVYVAGFTNTQAQFNEWYTAYKSIGSKDKCYDLDVTKWFVVTDAKEYLKTVSAELYGVFSDDALHDGEWPAERITPLDRAGIDAIIKKYLPQVPERYYYTLYSTFGFYGREVLDKEVNIEIAQSVIDNSEKFDEFVASIDEAVATLRKSYEDAQDAQADAVDAVEAQELVIAEIEKVFTDKIRGYQTDLSVKNEILKTYMSLQLPEDMMYTEESIKYIKDLMEASIELAEGKVYDKETAVMVAKDALENIAKPDATKLENAKFALKIANLDREEAKKAMDRAEKELNDATAKIMGDDAE